MFTGKVMVFLNMIDIHLCYFLLKEPFVLILYQKLFWIEFIDYGTILSLLSLISQDLSVLKRLTSRSIVNGADPS
jgi:hypothetical protein